MDICTETSNQNPYTPLVGTVVCRGEYDDGARICLWHGRVTDCEVLNGVPICPVCGSGVRRLN